ncbi:MAG: hypothetical protein HQL09_03560 [Nitrospirae bacterium]|nr:hypothetical protein [Nitrospirota bacterium]
MKRDNSKVDRNTKLRELQQWRVRCEKEMPFYINTGEGSFLFNGKPEIVRGLWRTYNIYRYNTCLEFVSYLNEEGVEARKIAVPMDRILGYPVKLSNN